MKEKKIKYFCGGGDLTTSTFGTWYYKYIETRIPTRWEIHYRNNWTRAEIDKKVKQDVVE